MRVRVRVQLLEVVEMGGGEIVRVVRPSRWMGRRRGWMAGMMRLSRRRVRAFRAFAFLSFSQSAFTKSCWSFLAIRCEESRRK